MAKSKKGRRKKPTWERYDLKYWILQFGTPNKWIEIERKAPKKYIVRAPHPTGSYTATIRTFTLLEDAKKFAYTWIGADAWTAGETNPTKTKKITCVRCKGSGKSTTQFEKRKGKSIPMSCDFCGGVGSVPAKTNPQALALSTAKIKRSLEVLSNKIEQAGSLVWFAVTSDGGKVDFVTVKKIEGEKGDPETEIRAWAKKNKVSVKWPDQNPKKKTAAVRARKQPQIPPPFKKLTKSKINKLKSLFRVHPEEVMNPDPGDCPNCGMAYKDLKTGLDFKAVQDMLWIQDSDPEFWRHKRRGSVLGLWFEIKRSMWADHLAMCGDAPMSEAQYLEHLDQLGDY